MRFIPVYTGNTRAAEDVQDREAVYPCVYREHTKGQQKLDCLRGLSLCIQGTLKFI